MKGFGVVLGKWVEAQTLAADLRSHPVTSLRVNAAHELGEVVRPGGCFISFRGKGSGDFHLGAYSRDAFAYSVATSALCEALLTDASAAVHEAAMGALRKLDAMGDEGVKHTLLSVLALYLDPGSTELREVTLLG